MQLAAAFLCSLLNPQQQQCHAIREWFPSVWLLGQLGQKKPCRCYLCLRALMPVPQFKFLCFQVHDVSNVLEPLNVPL